MKNIRWFWAALAVLGIILLAANFIEHRWKYTTYEGPYAQLEKGRIAAWVEGGATRDERIARELETAYMNFDYIAPGAMMKIDRLMGREYVLSKDAHWVRLR